MMAGLARALEAAAMALLAAMTLLIVAQIGARDVLQVGAPWAEELARWCGLGVVYLVVPRLLLEGRHVTVDLLPNGLSGRPQRALAWLNETLTLAFGAIFLAGGWLFMQRAARFTTPALGMPNWLFYLPAFVGMAAFTLVAVARLARMARGLPATAP